MICTLISTILTKIDRILGLEDSATYLRVILNALHRLLLSLTSTSTELRLQTLLLLLFDLTSVSSVILLSSLGKGINSTVILLHSNESLTLAHVRTDELGVAGNSLVAVLHGLRERHQLDQSGGTVRVAAGILGRALGHLGKGVDGTGPVGFLEFLLAELAGLFSKGGIDVGVLLGSDLGLLGGAELGQGLGGAVLHEGLVVVFDGLGEVTQLLVR
jgi:hypothetical protein